MSRLLKKFISRVVTQTGYQIRPLPSGKPSPIHLWDEDVQFNHFYQQITDTTAVSKQRCFLMYQVTKQVSNLPGCVAEVGVYKGGTAKLLAQAFEPIGKQLHLFDTFSGLPPADPDKDPFYFAKEGAFADTSLANVKIYLQDYNEVHLHPGLFPDTAAPVRAETFCLAHVDVDIYQSVMDCCKFFYPRLAKGGALIFDDYGDLSCPGARLAVDEYFLGRPENPWYLPTGQALVIRL